MKKLLLSLSVVALALSSCCGGGENAKAVNDGKITIKGKVQFDDPNYKMEIYQRNGFDKTVVAEFDINPDGTYEYVMDVKEPGKYSLDCKKWQTVDFWAEDEDLEINFRGLDTAKIKIKNPPYVYINGGELNDVMNDLNFLVWANYQQMIALSQAAYRADISSKAKTEVSGSLYDVLNDDYKRRVRYIVEKYGDLKSVLAVLPSLRDTNPVDAPIIEKTLATLNSKYPNYKPLSDYVEAVRVAKENRERMNIGKPMPQFSFPTVDGTKTLGPQDFKGKLLIIDFWASWCGPCIGEIPSLRAVAEKYKGKVEILGVSIDSREKDWKKALESHDAPWHQVLAPGSGKDIMKTCQFSGIPFIVLLDADGNIVAKGLRGDKIEEAVKKALGL